MGWLTSVALAASVAACGRIAFDPVSPRTDADGNAPGSVTLAAVFTADNGYRLAWGRDAIEGVLEGHGSTSAGDIFLCPLGNGPQLEQLTVNSDAYIYVAAWSDLSVTQGLIGNLTGTRRRFTDASWQVCAVGVEYASNSMGPDQPTLEVDLASCNAGAAGTSASRGWVDVSGPITPGAIGLLAVGEANDSSGGTFQNACAPSGNTDGIDLMSHWIWYDPQDGMSAFMNNANNRTKSYHLYRLPAAE
jgi:hypothetical protein